MNKNKLITINKFLSTSNVDRIGKVFVYKGGIYRGIYPESIKHVTNIINSGLIEELNSNNLFPKTKITNYYTKEFPLILSHQRIRFKSYPQEWSFEMLKDAALTTLKVNSISNKFGYQTIDAHFGNIIFDYSQPKFTDFGSFIKLEKPGVWRASEEFLRAFYYPLSLWSRGFETLSSRLVVAGGSFISHSEYRKIIYFIPRLIPTLFLNKLLNTYFILKRISGVPDSLVKNRVHPVIFKIFKYLKNNNLLPFQKFDNNMYIKKIRGLKTPPPTYWKNYYKTDDFIPKRFEKIEKIIHKKNINEIVELASNNGAFTRRLLKNIIISKSVCIDYDKGSIDRLYLIIKNRKQNIVPVGQDILNPFLTKHNEALYDRFKSEAVFALALTHHLILTQYIPIDKILDTITKFSNKHVFIEFMPLGLWNGKYAPPVPKWYNQKWFEKNLSKYCKITDIVRLEKNRTLFVGKVIYN